MNIQDIIKSIEAKAEQYEAFEKHLMEKGEFKEALHMVSKRTGLWEALIIVQQLNSK